MTTSHPSRTSRYQSYFPGPRTYPPPYISDSQLSTYRECQQKWAWKYLYPGGSQEDESGIPASFSSMLIHPALSALLEGHPWTAQQWHESYSAYQTEIASPLEPNYTLALAHRIVEEFTKEQLPLDQEDYTFISSESLTVKPLFPPDHPDYTTVKPYLSIPDGVYCDHENNLWVLDFKVTTREQSNTYLLPYLEQQIGQCHTTGAKGWLISCFLLTFSRSKDPSKHTKPKINHTRYKVTLRKDHYEQWLAQTRKEVYILSHLKKDSILTRNSSSCFSWNRPCPYLDVCKAGAFSSSLTSQWATLSTNTQPPNQEKE